MSARRSAPARAHEHLHLQRSDEAIQFEPRPKAERGAQCTLKISVGPSRNGLLWLVNGKPIGTAAQMAAVLAVTLRALEKEASR